MFSSKNKVQIQDRSGDVEITILPFMHFVDFLVFSIVIVAMISGVATIISHVASGTATTGKIMENIPWILLNGLAILAVAYSMMDIMFKKVTIFIDSENLTRVSDLFGWKKVETVPVDQIMNIRIARLQNMSSRRRARRSTKAFSYAVSFEVIDPGNPSKGKWHIAKKHSRESLRNIMEAMVRCGHIPLKAFSGIRITENGDSPGEKYSLPEDFDDLVQ